MQKYNGKNVQLKFKSTSTGKLYAFIDNIQIKETPAVDLEISGVTAPKNVMVEEEFDITVEVTNLGYDTAKNFKVNLYRDGDVVDSQDIAALDSDESINVVFENLISYFDDDDTQAIFTAEVVCPEDADLANNVWDDVVVNRPVSNLTTVNDLVAENGEDGVKLTWTPYDAATANGYVKVTEDFEGGQDGTTVVDGWTMVDRDGQTEWPVGGDVIAALLNGTWSVCDVTDINGWDATSGKNILVSDCPQDGSPCSNWAISPLLSSKEQTIIFWAKALNTQYGSETLSVYGSYSDSLDPDDFEIVKTISLDNDQWAMFEVELEEGMARFALVDESEDCFVICLDDVTFESATPAEGLNLVGYDVYRNGVKVGETDGEGEFVDTEAGLGKHIYHVVAKYAEGNSELSNPAEIEITENSGIFDVTSKAQASVKVDGRDIVISNAAGNAVAISTIDGKLLFTANGDARFTAAPAFYLVTVNGRAYKVVVR